jgi:hypothetical protein
VIEADFQPRRLRPFVVFGEVFVGIFPCADADIHRLYPAASHFFKIYLALKFAYIYPAILTPARRRNSPRRDERGKNKRRDAGEKHRRRARESAFYIHFPLSSVISADYSALYSMPQVIAAQRRLKWRRE